MSLPLLMLIAAICGYLFLICKQRRRRGLPPLPIIGNIFDALLDAEEQLTGATTKTSAAQNTTDEIPRPVAILEKDFGEYTSHHANDPPPSTTTAIQPHPILKAAAGESVMFPAPPEQQQQLEDRRLPGAGMTSTYLMPKQLPDSPVSPLSNTTSPQSVAFPVNEQKLQNEEVINVPAPIPLPPSDPSNEQDPDSKDSKDSQDPNNKKKKKNKKKKSKKGKNKDSKDKKRWSKHKHHDKKKKEATVLDPNNNIPPIL